MTPAVWRRIHASLTVAWFVAVIPTVVWWSESVLWIGLLSCWANAASHFSAYQATRAEESGNGSSSSGSGNG